MISACRFGERFGFDEHLQQPTKFFPRTDRESDVDIFRTSLDFDSGSIMEMEISSESTDGDCFDAKLRHGRI